MPLPECSRQIPQAVLQNALRGFVFDSISFTIAMLTYSCKNFTVSVVLISFLLFCEFSSFLILIGQKNCCEGSVCFGYDPQFFACGRLVGAQEPKTMFQAQSVFLSVFFVQVAPISANMAFQKLLRCFPRPLQGLQSARSGDDLPQSKKCEFAVFPPSLDYSFLGLAPCFLCGGLCRTEKQMLFLDAPLRMAVRAVKGGGVSRSSERSEDP